MSNHTHTATRQRSDQHHVRQIPAAVRRRFGYPAPYHGRSDDLADRVEGLEAIIGELTTKLDDADTVADDARDKA